MQGTDPVVADWAARRTRHAAAWTPTELTAAKADHVISVVLPARDEEATIGAIVGAIGRDLTGPGGLVDEILVVDSRSTDATARIAAAAGARVVRQDEVTRGLTPMDGKGDAMWAGLAASRGDLVVFLDADLRAFSSRFVTGLLGPLLTDPSVAFVKGFYHRPLTIEGHADPDGGGRVTELVARPLLNLFWPRLAGFIQPLSGECAGRREVLSRVPFVSGYGVETAMMIDLLELVGLEALAQVDLGERRHRNQSNQALGRMSAQIVLAAWSRLRRQGWVSTDAEPGRLLTQFVRDADGPAGREAQTVDVGVTERPPLASLLLPGAPGRG
ncbi:glucosyl-3-phosphoglycerate synthase [Pilimelia columellifera]